MRVAIERLGHSQTGLTVRTYGSIAPVLMGDDANRLDEALRGS
jgi:hypothetical protein